ncbi:site-specific DNA-methyltransferase [bacterium]|nr:site-specific DNA-methyltransferase [bacterium]
MVIPPEESAGLLESTERQPENGKTLNKLYTEDRAYHDWYRFVLSFPPHLVRTYIQKFGLTKDDLVLDPFCGTGTTVVECKKNGIRSIGIESHPMMHFASQVKVDWSIDPDGLMAHSNRVASRALEKLESEEIDDNPAVLSTSLRNFDYRNISEEKQKLLLTNSISPLPLHKTLVLLDCLAASCNQEYQKHQLIALAKALVYRISNLNFGPEVGVGLIKKDAPVVSSWLSEIKAISNDLRLARIKVNKTSADVYRGDARDPAEILGDRMVDAVITSPPYPNEKDYTRTTRLESVLLGLIADKADLKKVKQGLMRSNTRNVYKGDSDHEWITEFDQIQTIAEEIEKRRIDLGKTSGFERLYGKVTKLYFGGMARHLSGLRRVLAPGARLAYVVGDQASYLQVMIRTGEILSRIAESLGYETIGIDLFRTRLATATKQQLREEVVLLRWPGTSLKK